MSAPARRVRFGLSSAVLLLAATVSCVLVAVIGERARLRWDVTATRQFTLADRTLRTLATVDEPVTVVVSAPLGQIEPDMRRRMTDLLDEFTKSNELVRSTWIDTGSPAAPARLGELLRSLCEPVREALDAQRATLEALADDSARMQEALGQVSDDLKLLAEALSAAAPGPGAPRAERAASLVEQAGLVRTIATRLAAATQELRQASAHSYEGAALPAVDWARERALTPIQETSRAAGAIASFVEALPEVAGFDAKSLVQRARALRDASAGAADDLVRLKPLDPLIVARVLQASSAVMVASPSGTIAIDFQRLFPPAGAGEGGLGALFAGEQLLATAIGGLKDRAAPILVFVHAQAARLLDDQGEPTAPARAAFGSLFDRLRLTRATPVEWPVATQPARPDLSAIDPSSQRPAVYIVLGAPSRAGADARQPAAVAERTTRIAKLGDALRTLLAAGESMLVSIEPSELPSLGEPDPVARAFGEAGVRIESGRPLLRRESSPQGTLVWTNHVVRLVDEAHAIQSAVRGLAVALPWVSPIDASAAGPGVRTWPLLRIEAQGKVWGESQWFTLREAAARGAASPFAPLRLAEPPKPDESRDVIAPEGESFIAALAAERDRGPSVAPLSRPGPGPQRVVVVASPAWFDDGVARASEEVSGRRVQLFPGNLELFEACVQWLAGRDEQIAAGPQSRDVPRIGAISDGALTAVRLLVIVGLPSLVLIAGGLWRVLRG